MIRIRKTNIFSDWFTSLRDKRAQARIQVRIDRLSLGLLGDVKFFDGIGEMRIDYGPGYRVYFTRRQNEIVILLCGGDKGSQTRDIERAIKIAAEV
ncbi:type II toxin-antitoxin system RelE/ParE family toxin [Agrobacterium larrymoorei]|uniref:Type II toxin-antitoxin system RelE/ParE family toxin n=2 Tax=Agrobacterium larrymoorei TaxID=160699 RepID=A0A4D7DTW6_9HYPH|nr:type II toxin-antitoxin system RelE/ParE family toxin [Agrobacterium larrymoorei]QCI99037.1 type II toxin-antitoxin system RelE/ParE family toxin [Agrobacterium larrymoorei]QYA08426.1 type II toxin-antitoxin system RelE/ParE family toxin [Agrobacterium larrymoorei]